MATTRIAVPAGTTSAIYPVTPLVSTCFGPQVLGGTIGLEFSSDGRTTWTPITPGGLTYSGMVSYRPSATGYLRFTATTQAAVAFLSDVGGSNTQYVDQIAAITGPLASVSGTAEQLLYSLRIPPGFMPQSWIMRLTGFNSQTNNANVKTLKVRVSGIAGTTTFTSPSLASTLNYNWQHVIACRGDGQNQVAFGVATTAGWGTSTTAYTAPAVDTNNVETEIAVTITKATAGDAAVLEGLLIELF